MKKGNIKLYELIRTGLLALKEGDILSIVLRNAAENGTQACITMLAQMGETSIDLVESVLGKTLMRWIFEYEGLPYPLSAKELEEINTKRTDAHRF